MPLNENEQQQVYQFFDMDIFLRRLKAVEKKVSIGKKNPIPAVTGSTDSTKLASLIAALDSLGLVDNQTT